jgi:hypothetical protein
VLVQQTIDTTDVVVGTKVVNGQTVTTNERFTSCPPTALTGQREGLVPGL